MSGIWSVIVPEAATNFVLNPSAEAADNFGGLFVGSPSVSGSPSGSASPSGSQSRSPSASTSPSGSQSKSPSASASPSASVSPTPSGSVSPSTSVSPSPSPSAGIAAVSRVTTYARFGDYCYYIQTPQPYDGLWLALLTLANAAHYVSLYLYDNVTGIPQVCLDGHTFYSMSVIGGRDTGWLRYGVSIPASEANASKRLDIRMPTEEDFYVDAVQVEANAYGTTYIDGDRGSPFYRWNGLRHGSSSTRSVQERTGGRERNLLDDYGVEVVEGTKRIGMPPVIHNLQSMSLLPGALHQGTKILPREIEFHLNYSSDSWAGFHGKRNDVIDLLKPDLVRGSQPIVIGYAGAGTDKKVYSNFYYNGGLEFGDFLAYDEVAVVRLLAPDPFWYADDQETATLDYQDTVANSARANRRTNGQWLALATGFNGDVRDIQVDVKRGRIYFCGTFTTPTNRICYWDQGLGTFVSMGNGVAGGAAHCMAIAANGDVHVGGAFTTVNGVASNNYYARWNFATSTWTAFGAAVPTGAVLGIKIKPSNQNIYLNGGFVNWDGNANADYVVSYDGATWSALGTPPFSTVSPWRDIDFDAGENLYVGNTNGTLYKWDGSTWTLLVTVTGGTSNILHVRVLRNGNVLFTGDFTSPGNNVSLWNGSSSVALGSGVNSAAYDSEELADGRIALCGQFSSAGGLSLADRFAYWNGYVWVQPDIDLPGSPIVQTIRQWKQTLDLFIGYDTTGSATAAGITTVTNGGSTIAFPRLSIINDNASGSCILQWFENQSSDHLMYFNLTVQAGEKVELDLSDSQKHLTSDWRGVITNNPLQNSDVTNWKLLPGANTIAAFITGTITSVVALLHWTPKFWSADGQA